MRTYNISLILIFLFPSIVNANDKYQPLHFYNAAVNSDSVIVRIPINTAESVPSSSMLWFQVQSCLNGRGETTIIKAGDTIPEFNLNLLIDYYPTVYHNFMEKHENGSIKEAVYLVPFVLIPDKVVTTESSERSKKISLESGCIDVIEPKFKPDDPTAFLQWVSDNVEDDVDVSLCINKKGEVSNVQYF